MVFVYVFASSSVFADIISVWGGEKLSSDPVFNFDSDPVGKSTPFTDTVSGLGATFTSSGDPGGFDVAFAGTAFSTLTGNVLFEPGPAGLNNLTLTIVFSALQTNISMNFVTNSFGSVPFDLNLFNGGSAVGSATATGVVPPGFFFPEGGISSFGGPAFNRVVLSAPEARDFAIDNVAVSAVPEPRSLSLLVSGTLGVIAITRLRRLSGAYRGVIR
jgi:hypothetical protein